MLRFLSSSRERERCGGEVTSPNLSLFTRTLACSRVMSTPRDCDEPTAIFPGEQSLTLFLANSRVKSNSREMRFHGGGSVVFYSRISFSLNLVRCLSHGRSDCKDGKGLLTYVKSRELTRILVNSLQ